MERLRYRLQQYQMRLRFQDPERQLREKQQQLLHIEERLREVMGQRLEAAKHRLALTSQRLHDLSPLERISNGFGFVTDRDGRRLESVRKVQVGDMVMVRISDGKMAAQVTEVSDLS